MFRFKIPLKSNNSVNIYKKKNQKHMVGNKSGFSFRVYPVFIRGFKDPDPDKIFC